MTHKFYRPTILFLSLLTLLCLPLSNAQAEQMIKLQCDNMSDPIFGNVQQGEERYLRVTFRNDDQGNMLIEEFLLADNASPFENPAQGMQPRLIKGDPVNDTTLAAVWEQNGQSALIFSAVFLGNKRWGAILQSSNEIKMKNLTIAAGSELELRCRDITPAFVRPQLPL